MRRVRTQPKACLSSVGAPLGFGSHGHREGETGIAEVERGICVNLR